MDSSDSLNRKVGRWAKKLFKVLLWGLLLLIAVLIVGLIPVNNDFRPTEDGIKIFVVSNAVHADIVLPVLSAEVDWSERFANAKFSSDVRDQSHVAFGWGDRGFFLETETWDDFKISTAANALLLPSESCMHVSFVNLEAYQDSVSVTISPEQYIQLVKFINDAFEVNDQGKCIQIPDEAYSTNDAFFKANGRYHFFNTCNSWIGRCLKVTGVKTPWLSPLPKTPMWYIESEADLQ